jgi:acetyl-CoA synthetase
VRTVPPDDATKIFRDARDTLLAAAEDYHAAIRDFRWPVLPDFNWAIDWFDAVLAVEHADEPALWIVDGTTCLADDLSEPLTFADLARRSNEVAGRLRAAGIDRGDRVLVMLDNQVELWESYLALMKLGAVIVPIAPALGAKDCARLVDGVAITHVVAGSRHTPKFRNVHGGYARIAVGPPIEGWLRYDAPAEPFDPAEVRGLTRATDPLLVLSTPGTTGAPKLVEHTHGSYPVGHLSTMYWIGLRPDDMHLSVCMPGWAKHCCNNLFAPWNAGACVLICTGPKLTPADLLVVLDRCVVTTMCAPPMALVELAASDDLSRWSPPWLRALVTMGEPLNPMVLDRILRTWGIVVREGYGQSEATVMVGQMSRQPITYGSMGRPLPGYSVVLVDPVSNLPVREGEVGEICLDLDGPTGRPPPLTSGYLGDPDRTAQAFRGRYYHTGDVAFADSLGYLTWLGAVDDVFLAGGCWISPSELESVVAEHAAVAEVGVIGPQQPKAYVVLHSDAERSAELARTILTDAAYRVSPLRRVRRLEFVDALPRTPTSKLRRHALRSLPPGEEYEAP